MKNKLNLSNSVKITCLTLILLSSLLIQGADLDINPISNQTKENNLQKLESYSINQYESVYDDYINDINHNNPNTEILSNDHNLIELPHLGSEEIEYGYSGEYQSARGSQSIGEKRASAPSTLKLSQISIDSFTPHGPIEITSDADFSTTASSESWAGTGTSGDPYIIEGYDITGGGSIAIYIYSTTVYFIIRNNYVHDTSTYGIYVNNAENGLIQNNIVENAGSYSLVSSYSNSISFEDNYVSESNGFGLYIYRSVDTYVQNNSIIDASTYGIRYYQSNSSTIIDNYVENSGSHGLGLEHSWTNSVTIQNNTIVGNTNSGVYLSSAGTNINILDNYLGNNQYGLYSQNSESLDIFDNHIEANILSGLSIRDSDNHLIDNNVLFSNGDHGLFLFRSIGTTIQNNLAQENDNSGIYINRSNSTTYSNNSMIGNADYGLLSFIGISNSISLSFFNNNLRDGIQLRFTNSSTINNNTLNGNGFSGLALIDDSFNNLVYDLVAIENLGNGLYFRDVFDTSVYNNDLYENGDAGLQLVNSNNNIVETNALTNNTGYGVKLTSSGSNTIRDNTYTHDGFYIQGNELEHYQLTEFSNNIADGKEIHIIENTIGTLPLDPAQLIFVNIQSISISNFIFNQGETPLIIAFGDDLTISNNQISNSSAMGMAIANVNNSIIENNIFSQNKFDGLIIDWSGWNNVIQNNEFHLNERRGLFIVDQENHLVTENLSYNNTWTNLVLVRTHNSIVSDNTLYSSINNHGLTIDRSENNTITLNNIYQNDDGIRIIGNSHNTQLSQNEVYLNNDGIISYDSNTTLFENNFVYENSAYGVTIVRGYFNLIQTNNITESSYYGIFVLQSSNVTVAENNVYNNTLNGITLYESRYNFIFNNTSFENGWDGIALYEDSHYNLIEGNSSFDNQFKGIYFSVSSFNNASVNYVESNKGHGIILASSQQNIIFENEMVDNGFYIQASNNTALLQDIVANNTVNGKPLIYIQQSHSSERIHDAGQVVVIESSYVFIEGNDLNNATTGVLVRNSHHVTISGNSFTNNSYYGVVLTQGTNDSVVIGNNFIKNRINTTSQAYDNGVNNIYSYNYWDTGSLVDVDEDGISEVPYFIDGDSQNRDNTPLVQPYTLASGPMSEPTIITPNGGESLDGEVTIDWETVETSNNETVRYNLYYSDDGGSTFFPLVQGIVGQSTYDWDTSSFLPGSSYLIKVTAMNLNTGQFTEDLSDNVFSIAEGDFFDNLSPAAIAALIAAVAGILAAGGLIIRSRLRG